MRADEYGVYEKRITKFLGRLKGGAPLLAEIPFHAEYSHSVNPVAFSDRLKGSYQEIKKGDKWGSAWDSAWFKLTVTVPQEWDGKEIVAHLNFNGESLVFGADGCPLFGLTNGSVFAMGYGKDVYYFNRCAKGGEKIELWVESAANHLFGINQPGDPARTCPERHGSYEGRVINCELCLFSRDLWHLLLDIDTLNSLLAGLRTPSINTNDGNAWGSLKKLIQLTPRQKKIVYLVNEAITAYADNPANAAKAREVLKPLFSTPANASDLNITAVGHAHIDTGWLWPVRESIRKCGRTFASQIELMKKYPGYVFGASQPQLYQFTKDHYPALYAKIKEYVKNGQWECQGGMWVEADCNITGGEAMIRQFVTGKNFYKDEFDFDVRNLWIPDVFGYSAAMPQIMKKCGVDFFLTQKISWSQFNEFPHNTFNWRGIDGTEILTHFPPEDGYNSEAYPAGQLFAQKNFKESHLLPEAMCLYGIGDGGGGPKEEYVERVLRMNDLEGCPKVKFGRADEFFNRIHAFRDELECWNGELYLELHRGTLTTQARTKKGNRMLERKLRETEFVCSCLPFAEYPAKELDRLWKTLLINQFHDILPGSSIRKVYEVTEREHAQSIAECDELIAKAAARLLQPAADTLTLVNILSYDYTAPVTLPASWKGSGVTDLSGKALPTQEDDNGLTVLATIPACGVLGLRKGPAVAGARTAGTTLENSLIRYEFAADGTLLSAFDKEAGREVLAAGEKGNLLSLYIDRPNDWDAWDIEITYQNELFAHARTVSTTPLSSGGVRQGIQFTLAIGDSTIRQSVYLNAGSKRLDFITDVDWKEKHKMLRVSFPANVVASEASFDIQYGFARRATHTNTSWDVAKFEVPAHKYADLSADGYGVAILNNCKYGHKVQGNVLDLNLLRSSTYPDADADIGAQSFTYSLLPHTGDLTSSSVQAEANMLNFPPVTLEGVSPEKLALPVSFSGKGVSLEVVKKAEKENCHVLRLVETAGRTSKCKLTLNQGSGLTATNMLEWTNERELAGKTHELTLKPFEILTFKVRS